MKCLYVVGNPNRLSAAESTIREVLQRDLSLEVTHRSASAPADAAEDVKRFHVIVISGSVSPVAVGGRYANHATSVLLCEFGLTAHFGLNTGPSGRDEVADALYVKRNDHPITAGLHLGQLAVYSRPSTLGWRNASTAAGGLVLAEGLLGAFQHHLVAYEVGDRLATGMVAQGRRVFCFVGGASELPWTPEGVHLFVRSVRWCLAAREHELATAPTLYSPDVTVGDTFAWIGSPTDRQTTRIVEFERI